jgi:intein/homing endonuclease
MSEGNSFFVYTSESVDSLASCCFKGDERITLIENNSGNKINISMKDFVNFYTKEGETKIEEKYSIESFNFETNNMELSKITGVLSKKNEQSRLIKIKIRDQEIKVTPDHLFFVKNKETNKLEEISAEKIIKNKNKYLIPINC